MDKKNPEEAREFSNTEFDQIRDIFYNLTGNRIGDTKQSLIESRLTRRIHALKMTSKEYVDFLYRDTRERETLTSLLTTHKTDWFREFEHFEFLKEALNQGLINTHGKPIFIWSAACSTGEEVYSLAIFLNAIGFSYRILGSDISEECLLTCEKGIYKKESVDQQVDSELIKKYFLGGKGGKNEGLYRVEPLLGHTLKWKKHNLMDAGGLQSDLQFDFIFLRNALIYFDPETVHDIISSVIKSLKPSGYLILGLSETVLKPASIGLKRVANSIYIK